MKHAVIAFGLCVGGAGLASAHDMGVGVHSHGYMPHMVPATTKIVVGRKDRFDPRAGFDVYVIPNLVPQAEAAALAATRAAAFCAGAGATRAKIIGAVRHSAYRLDAWGFRGICRR